MTSTHDTKPTQADVNDPDGSYSVRTSVSSEGVHLHGKEALVLVAAIEFRSR